MWFRHVLYLLSYEGTPISLPQSLLKLFPEKIGLGITPRERRAGFEPAVCRSSPGLAAGKSGEPVGSRTLLDPESVRGCFAAKASSSELVVTAGVEPAPGSVLGAVPLPIGLRDPCETGTRGRTCTG